MLVQYRLSFHFRFDEFTERFLDLKLFADCFHDLCDGIEDINNLFAFHLVPILLTMLVIDVFLIYNFFQWMMVPEIKFIHFMTVYYLVIHLILRTILAHIGSTATREPEKLIEIMAKLINHLSLNHPSRFVLDAYMKQFQTRKFKFQTLFLNIDWNIVLSVM